MSAPANNSGRSAILRSQIVGLDTSVCTLVIKAKNYIYIALYMDMERIYKILELKIDGRMYIYGFWRNYSSPYP